VDVVARDASELAEDRLGLEAVCRSALVALGARRITVWRCGDDGRFTSPYVSVGAPGGAESGLTAGFETRLHGEGRAHVEALHRDGPLGFVVIEPPEAAAASGVVAVLVASADSWLAQRAAGTGRPDHGVLAELAVAAETLDASVLLRFAAQRLAGVLGARRTTIFSEDEPGYVHLRMSARADGSSDDETDARMAAKLEPFHLVKRVLANGRPAVIERASSELVGSSWASEFDMVSILAVPLAERAVMVLDSDRPCAFGPDELEVAVRATDYLGAAARSVRRRRETSAQETIAGAFRQLLEAGVRACTSMEAAEAIAATAASVLGLPTACAYLVDPAGRISEIATVGAAPGLAEQLRESLIGKRAIDSPVWKRAVEGSAAGPDLIADTAVLGRVRPGGVAEVLGLRSLATIPLLSSDGPVGLVLCGDPAPRPHWRLGDRAVLAQLALEGAVVVDNARLREGERHEASHDPLTGLLNRRAFSDRFRHALGLAATDGRALAVLVVDLDRFKEVNDVLGHHCGDTLLIEVGGRLRAELRGDDILARMGGDEFAVVLTSDGGRKAVETVVARMKRALEQPVALGATTLRIEASIGIAFFPEQGDDVNTLLQRADLAMYAAKRSARRTEVFRAGMQARAELELGLLGDLRHALERPDELLLHYQPKVELRTNEVVGAEALVRWDHPKYGMLGADAFVPLAEDSGLVSALTAWVVPTALRQVQEWRGRGVDLRMSVNISAHDLADPHLGDLFAAWLRRARLPGDCLVVEVTEGALLRDGDTAPARIQDLRTLGIEVSLDDFGTGYSSLAYLECLPVDEIKIDKSFLETDVMQRRVLRAIIDLGHGLGLRVVAEGVETIEQRDWLTAAGCDEAQGYLLSRPVGADAFIGWMAKRSRKIGAGARRTAVLRT
jgi:diguanylate cyclase (GGDEF)-like protein